jgi:hypothetical protein
VRGRLRRPRKRRTKVSKQRLTKRNMVKSYNRTLLRTAAARLLISESVRVLARGQLIRTIFGPFGPQNRNFGPNGTEREKRQYWLAEDAVGSELLSALTGKFTGRSDAL